jgi:hypothetical protein
MIDNEPESDPRSDAAQAAFDLLGQAGYLSLSSNADTEHVLGVLAHCFNEFERSILYGIAHERSADNEHAPERRTDIPHHIQPAGRRFVTDDEGNVTYSKT